MVLIGIKSAKSHDPRVEIGLVQNASVRFEHDTTTLLDTFLRGCTKLDVIVEDEKLTLPAMPWNDLNVNWTRSNISPMSFSNSPSTTERLFSVSLSGIQKTVLRSTAATRSKAY
jgi:hypothetical protein